MTDEIITPELKRKLPGQLEAAKATDDDTVLRSVADGFILSNSTLNIPYVVREGLHAAGGIDPNFTLTEELLNQTADEFGLQGPARVAFFEQSDTVTSDTHLRQRARLAADRFKRDERLSQQGLGASLVYHGLGAILDPLVLGSVTAIARAPKIAYAMTRAARAKRIAAGGGVAALEGVAQEGVVAMGNPHRDMTDVLVVGVTGFGLGGALTGALGRAAVKSGATPSTLDANVNMDRVLANMDEQVVPLSAIDELDPEYVARVDAERAEATGIADELVDDGAQVVPLSAIDELDPKLGERVSDSVGAAKAIDGPTAVIEEKNILDAAADYADIPDKAKNPVGARIDSIRALRNHPDPKVRALGAALAPEHIGFLDATFIQKSTAMEIQQQLDAYVRVPYKRSMLAAYQQFLGASGRSKVGRLGAALGYRGVEFDNFASEVGRMIRTGSTPPTPHHAAAAQAVRKALSSALEEGQKAGVFSQGIPTNPNYLPRVFNEDAIQRFVAEFGINPMERLITKSIQMANKEITADVADIIARGYVRTITRAAHGYHQSIVHGLTLDDVTVLRAELEDMGVNSDAIETVIAGVTKRTEAGGKVTHAKGRLLLDESASENYVGQHGEVVSLSVTDLLENNVDMLMDKYMRRVSGAAALKQTLGIQGTGSQIIRLREEVADAGRESGLSQRKREHAANVAEAIALRIAGLPLDSRAGPLSQHPLSATRRFTDGIRKFNFSTFMVQSGFASVAEFCNVLATGGFGLLFSGVANFRKLRRNMLTGKVDDDFIEFVEENLGVGADNLLHPMFSRFDDFGHELVDPRALTRIERGLNASQKVTAEIISQLGPMTRFQRRLVMLGVMRQLEGWALKGGNLSRGQRKRLTLMGLSDADLQKIKEGMQTHKVSVKSSYRDRTFTRSDLDKWMESDPETVSKLLTAIQREAHNNIIEGNIADAPLWVNHTVGRIATQFMTFAINAHTKLLLRNLELRDAQAAYSFLSAMMFASVAYMTQQYLNTIGRPEAREDALSPENIIKRSFARAGHVALLPQAVDWVAKLATDEPLLNARTSSLPSGTVTSNPTVATFDNAYRALTVGRNVSDNYQFSREQFRAISSLIPMVGRMIGVKAVMDNIADDLPRDSKIEDF